MKKLTISTLSLALLSGPLSAQSPFFQPAGGVVPASATRPAAAPLPPSNAVPVRVHFGGALTRDGVVPVPVFLQSNVRGAGPIHNVPPDVIPSNQAAIANHSAQHMRLTSRQKESAHLPAEACPPEVCHPAPPAPPFQPPRMEDYRRPLPEPHGHGWYTSGEYLHWWTKKQTSLPLIQRGNQLISAEDVDEDSHSGGRFIIGHWLCCPTPIAIEAVFMFLGEGEGSVSAASNGFPFVGRPFIDANTNTVRVVPIGQRGEVDRTGSSTLETHNRLWSFEVNLRRELFRVPGAHFDVIAGYRQLHLDEGIRITDRTVVGTAPVPLSDATILGVDQFGTHNQIFAGQFGVEAEVNHGRFYVDAWGKFALGGNRQTVNVNGFTTIEAPPAPVGDVELPGNVLAQITNIGRHRKSSFTVIPEAGFNVGMRLTPNWRMSAGYSVLFINNIVRPADQIDPFVNPSFIPQSLVFPAGVLRPTRPDFEETTYFAHGLNVQMEFRY